MITQDQSRMRHGRRSTYQASPAPRGWTHGRVYLGIIVGCTVAWLLIIATGAVVVNWIAS